MKTVRRVPKTLSHTLYCYVEEKNGKFVRNAYKQKNFDSYSEYVNALVAADRKDNIIKIQKGKYT